MKKLLVLTIFLSSLTACDSTENEWTKVVEKKDKTLENWESYVDFGTVKSNRGKVYYWTLNNYLTPNSSGIWSAKYYYKADSEAFRSGSVRKELYTHQMAKGELKYSYSTPMARLIGPSKNSTSEAVLRRVCRHSHNKIVAWLVHFKIDLNRFVRELLGLKEVRQI